MQPLSIERDVRRNGIRMDCVFEGTAFDTAREQVRTLRLSGTKLSQIAEQTGMPVEQVQKLLGHSKIDTTMQYAMVNQNNVKMSHRKYIS